MNLKRSFVPDSNESGIIYHYCSPESFHAICSNKTIRLTNIASMNDSRELTWGDEKLAEQSEIWRKHHSGDSSVDGFLKSVLQEIKMQRSREVFLVACFSLESDLLSQWRGYADDAKGFAIGFDSQSRYFSQLTPLKVIYDHQKQTNEIGERLDELFEHYKRPTGTAHDLFNIYGLSRDLAAYKHESFKEEREVRLIFPKLLLKLPPGHPRFPDSHPIGFSWKNSTPVPYYDCAFNWQPALPDLPFPMPIQKVMIGPRNPSTINEIEFYLDRLGLSDVAVQKSISSFR